MSSALLTRNCQTSETWEDGLQNPANLKTAKHTQLITRILKISIRFETSLSFEEGIMATASDKVDGTVKLMLRSEHPPLFGHGVHLTIWWGSLVI